MKECDACGSPVSDNYHRVFALNDGTLLACPECGRHGMIDHMLSHPGQYRDAGGQKSYHDARDTGKL